MLLLLSSLRVGGSEAKTVRLANALAQRGGHVVLAYLNEPDTLADRLDPEVTLIDLKRRGKLSLRALTALTSAIRAQRTGCLVSVNLYPALYASLARWRVGAGRPRWIAALNTTQIAGAKLAVQMPLYRWALSSADLLLFGAESQRQLWRERHGVGAHAGRTAVLHNGVDTARFAPTTRSPGPRLGLETRWIIGSVGQLRPEKAHLHLLRAAATLRAQGLDVGLVLVGEGPERARILAERDRLQLEPYVVLTGEMRDVRPALAAMDVFVLSSVAIETFSNAVLEAMACGVPVVSSRIGGMEELLEGGGGLLYPPGDAQALVRVLKELLPDEARRGELARAARNEVVQRFGWERMVQRFIKLLAGEAPAALRGDTSREAGVEGNAATVTARAPEHSLRRSSLTP